MHKIRMAVKIMIKFIAYIRSVIKKGERSKRNKTIDESINISDVLKRLDTQNDKINNVVKKVDEVKENVDKLTDELDRFIKSEDEEGNDLGSNLMKYMLLLIILLTIIICSIYIGISLFYCKIIACNICLKVLLIVTKWSNFIFFVVINIISIMLIIKKLYQLRTSVDDSKEVEKKLLYKIMHCKYSEVFVIIAILFWVINLSYYIYIDFIEFRKMYPNTFVEYIPSIIDNEITELYIIEFAESAALLLINEFSNSIVKQRKSWVYNYLALAVAIISLIISA